MSALVVPARCNGPRASANGGWTAGALAEQVPGQEPTPVTVRLMLPPPLETPMEVEVDGDVTRLTREGHEIAKASRGAAVMTARPMGDWHCVTLPDAEEASRAYPGFEKHPFPTCYACGPERTEGDGLRIFPGRLPDGRVAAPWHAHDADVPTTWAALDCVSGWSSDIEERPMVLGQITAEVLRRPEPGTTYVVVGTELSVEGRKTRTRSELFDQQGDLLAHADQVWIEVDPAALNALG